MTAIQKRAKEFANSLPYSERTQYFAEQGYIRGANEQEQITRKEVIEECCEALYGLMSDGLCDIPNIEKAKEFIRKQLAKNANSKNN